MIARRAFTIDILIALFIGIAGIVALRQINQPSQNEEPPSSQSNSDVPDLTLKDVDGNEVALRSLVGTPLVINSWAVWCPFCKKEIPDFVVVQKEFEDRMKIIAIDRAEPLQTVKGYTDELGVTNDLLFLLDPSDSFYRAIGGFAMPETIFVNAQGTIVEHKRGPMGVQEMREKIKRLIEL